MSSVSVDEKVCHVFTVDLMMSRIIVLRYLCIFERKYVHFICAFFSWAVTPFIHSVVYFMQLCVNGNEIS